MTTHLLYMSHLNTLLTDSLTILCKSDSVNLISFLYCVFSGNGIFSCILSASFFFLFVSIPFIALINFIAVGVSSFNLSTYFANTELTTQTTLFTTSITHAKYHFLAFFEYFPLYLTNIDFLYFLALLVIMTAVFLFQIYIFHSSIKILYLQEIT